MPGARLLFSLDPAVAHLNHGSFGAVPLGVQRVQQRLRDEMEANPLRFFARGLADRIEYTRRHLATFLGAEPDGAALVGNATLGTALVLQSLDLRAGDEIVLTDHGYGAVRLAVERETRRTGAVLRTLAIPLGATDDELVAIVRSGLRPGRTRLLITDQLSSATVRLFPAAAIAAAARDQGVPVLVDAAHVPGMLPVAVRDIGADFWVGNLHKWALAPRGTALLAVAPRWRSRIEPLAVSWEQASGFPLNVEYQSTLDYTPWLAAPTGLFTLRTLGLDAVRGHNEALAVYGQQVIGAALGLDPGDLPQPGGPAVAMRVLPLPPGLAGTVEEARALRQRIADELSAEVAMNARNGRGYLRISAQVYNRAEEYEQLAERLPALLARSGPR
ncbi:aminotransferase class V-fold PLP-dependent enzyme [Plantactinospora sp. KBS50]|uniref:aminotransferase class V-fold PLP-dependent enzyme n=1 Tax=Plantactinospora sp. KBS50 TaxID=2024580 RepID=UPI000BAACF9C|nr:aminotransferase class V-fold PLP-dependent enzyme [Plantactinospora sp. KBS50]ASW54018.1 aminotransferase [Plantactinospora sp. KBS50]